MSFSNFENTPVQVDSAAEGSTGGGAVNADLVILGQLYQLKLQVFPTATNRAAAAPLIIGELGLELDSKTIYVGNSTNTGDWTALAVPTLDAILHSGGSSTASATVGGLTVNGPSSLDSDSITTDGAANMTFNGSTQSGGGGTGDDGGTGNCRLYPVVPGSISGSYSPDFGTNPSATGNFTDNGSGEFVDAGYVFGYINYANGSWSVNDESQVPNNFNYDYVQPGSLAVNGIIGIGATVDTTATPPTAQGQMVFDNSGGANTGHFWGSLDGATWTRII